MSGNGTEALLEALTAEFAARPEVSAVVLGGSQEGECSDGLSDIDLYIYAAPEPPHAWRAELAGRFGERASIDNRFWEPGDEWVAARSGIIVDIMYRAPAWIEAQLDRVLLLHQASVGYSTCFVYNVLHSRPLYDRNGWFGELQAGAAQYPEELRRAIVAMNQPILRSTLSSYVHQIALALAREDLVSVNHRITALLASYFDILFAVNRLPHPGEKRLLGYVTANCPLRPPRFEVQVQELLLAAGRTDVFDKVNELLDGLDDLLAAEGLIAR